MYVHAHTRAYTRLPVCVYAHKFMLGLVDPLEILYLQAYKLANSLQAICELANLHLLEHADQRGKAGLQA